MLESINEVSEPLRSDLTNVQNRFLELSLPPDIGENWVGMQIEERWSRVFDETGATETQKEEVRESIQRLKTSLRYGLEPEVIESYDKLPEALKKEWVELLYQQNSRFDPGTLDRLIRILDEPVLDIPSRERSRKILTQLKALAETMNNLERNTNFLLRQVLNGKEVQKVTENPDGTIGGVSGEVAVPGAPDDAAVEDGRL